METPGPSASQSRDRADRAERGKDARSDASGGALAPIADTDSLRAFCARLRDEPFITVDTEFVRERTYWPLLCLIQIGGENEAAAIDPLAPGLDLAPVFDLMTDPGLLKVFHSARQDVEIFVHRMGAVPSPLFDTQVAAMVCGFGESVGYETLVNQIAKARLDKSSRFTDWSQRPLTDRQLRYALDDVTHLRQVYRWLDRRLEKTGRSGWLDEEMAVLTDPATYATDPGEAWRRLKSRSTDRRFLAVLRELASWREQTAQSRDLPRAWVVKDDALLDIAARAPRDRKELAQSRRLTKEVTDGRHTDVILDAVARGLAVPAAARPEAQPRPDLPPAKRPLVELLKVLLKLKCDEHHVAQKLVATGEDLDLIALDDAAPVPALHGWRRQVFGEAALDLKHGRIALAVDETGLKQVAVAPSD